MRRTIGLVFVLGVALGAQGADLGVAGRKLVLLDKLATAGRAKTVFVVRGDAGIAKGAAGDPGQLAGRFVWFYTDAPTSVGGAFDLANAGAGAWVANGRAAKYVNPDAALGTPTAVRVAIVQPGTRVKVVSPFALSDPGGSPNLFAGAPSAGGGISAILTITNGNDASVHRMCTRFATQDGSSVAYREIAAGAGRKLVARRGVAATCPTTTTTSTTTSTSTSVTSTTAPPCGDDGLAPYPICWGSCPAATPICAAGALGCECVAGTTPCGSASFPECDGACAAGEACQIGLSGLHLRVRGPAVRHLGVPRVRRRVSRRRRLPQRVDPGRGRMPLPAGGLHLPRQLADLRRHVPAGAVLHVVVRGALSLRLSPSPRQAPSGSTSCRQWLRPGRSA
jgi:hypothetical protein